MPKFSRLIHILFLGLALLFIGLLLRDQWSQLRAHEWQLQPAWLALAALLMVGSWFVEVWIWRDALARVGGRLSYSQAVRIWFASILVRYIPGNVWQPLGMTFLCRRQQIHPEATVTSIALYQAVNLLAVVPIAVFYLGAMDNTDLNGAGLLDTWEGPVVWLALVGLAAVVLFLARPGWLMALLNLALEKMGRTALPAHLDNVHLLRLLLVALGDWFLWGAAFAGLVFSLDIYPLATKANLLPHLLASFPIAYAAGYLSFVTPGGLAVREGTLYLLLAPWLGGSVATVAALAMRTIQVVLEVIVAGGVTLLAGPTIASPDAEIAEQRLEIG